MPSFTGTLRNKTLLTARLFEAKDPSLGVEYLRTHPVTTHPHLYIEKVEGRREVRDKLVTTAFATFLAAQLITDSTVIGDFKYHQTGTGVTGENITDTDMETPTGTLARDVGTQVQGASAVGYKSIATTTFAGTHAVTEHGLFSTAGAGGPPPTGGTLMDRTVFAAINVVTTNQIEWIYEITIAAGG